MVWWSRTIFPRWTIFIKLCFDFMFIDFDLVCFMSVSINCTLVIISINLEGVHTGEFANWHTYFFIDSSIQQGYGEQ